MPDSSFLKKNCWSMFWGVSIVACSAPWGDIYYWFILGVGIIFYLIWMLYLLNFNEGYIRHAVTVIFSLAFVPIYLAMIMLHTVFGVVPKLSKYLNFILVILPLLILIMVIFWLCLRSSKTMPFVIENKRVKLVNVAGSPNSLSIIVSSLSLFLTMAIVGALPSYIAWVVLGILCTACGCYLLYLLRDMISGLRVLARKEREENIKYTFEKIEEVRQARSHWWLPRLVKWLASFRVHSG